MHHGAVVERIITELKLLSGEFGVKREDVRFQEFPFSVKPNPGVIVSPLEEVEGESTNETSDIGYPVQITRVLHKLNSTDKVDGLEKRSNWRQTVFNRFNRVRLGFPGFCETMTRARYGNYLGKEAWDDLNIDSSIVIVTVWIRQPHQG